MVGCAVRDILMGRLTHDADMAFSGSVADFLKAHPKAQLVGKSVHVIILHGQEYMPLYNNNIIDDLRHRDLTINAFALDENGTIYAHPQSFHDLRHGILRPTSPQAFWEDPTRIYRLARFAATFPTFNVHNTAFLQACAVVKDGKHAKLPAERVGREFLKVLSTQKPSRFMDILQKMQALCLQRTYWFEELAKLCSHKVLHLGQWMDGFRWQDSSIPKKESKKNTSLVRFMFIAYALNTKTHKGFEEHPINHFAKRLAIPTHYIKAAYHFANTFEQAKHFSQLSLEGQAELLINTYKLGIIGSYWQGVDFLHKENVSEHAFAALSVLQKVHLPQQWQNKGKLSGEKLLQLQCDALQKYWDNYNEGDTI